VLRMEFAISVCEWDLMITEEILTVQLLRKIRGIRRQRPFKASSKLLRRMISKHNTG
jgi:hypothetical protein